MNLSETSLAQIVTLKPAAATVLENYDLDYCCHGKQTLTEACKNDTFKLEIVKRELDALLFFDCATPGSSFNSMPLNDLADYIVNKHHRYVKEATPRILAHLQKISAKHGDRYPELHEIYKLFAAVCDELGQHMYKEEYILFPRIRELVNSTAANLQYAEHGKNFLAAPIHVMESEHEAAGNMMHRIRSLTNHYVAPADACTTFKLTYLELNEYEHDLHRHVHLENNILFPKALQLFSKGHN